MNQEHPIQPATPLPSTPTPPPEPTPTPAAAKTPMNKLGLWSFIIAIGVVPAIYIVSFLISIVAGVLNFDGGNADKALGSFMSPIYGLLIAANISAFVLLVACGLGIASLFIKNKRNVLGIVGLCLSAVGLIVTFIVPLLMRSIFS